MKIAFVKTAGDTMASMRYRILLPAKALREREHEVQLVDSYISPSDYAEEKYSDFHVFGKHFNPEVDFGTAKIAQSKGSAVIFDICDNHFGNQFASYYRNMCALADYVTCNTPAMKEIIFQETGKDAHIIDDPYEYPEKEARFMPGQNPINVLWYGHFTNLDTVQTMANQFKQLEENISLCVVSNMKPKTPAEDKNLFISFHIWSIKTQENMLEWANFVALPTDIYDPRKITKSHNRLVEGIRAGRFVIAHPLPSYERFKDFAWIGTDLSDGICWADENPDLVLEKIKAGQKYLRENLSPDHIGQQWENLLDPK